MDVDRLSTGEKIAGGLGDPSLHLHVLRLVQRRRLRRQRASSAVSVGGSAWDALDVIPIILMIAILAAVAVAVIRLTDAVFEPPVSLNAVVAILGGDLGPADPLPDHRPAGSATSGGVSVDVNPAVGIFLGLIAAAGHRLRRLPGDAGRGDLASARSATASPTAAAPAAGTPHQQQPPSLLRRRPRRPRRAPARAVRRSQ